MQLSTWTALCNGEEGVEGANSGILWVYWELVHVFVYSRLVRLCMLSTRSCLLVPSAVSIPLRLTLLRRNATHPDCYLTILLVSQSSKGSIWVVLLLSVSSKH